MRLRGQKKIQTQHESLRIWNIFIALTCAQELALGWKHERRNGSKILLCLAFLCLSLQYCTPRSNLGIYVIITGTTIKFFFT